MRRYLKNDTLTAPLPLRERAAAAKRRRVRGKLIINSFLR